MLHYARGSATDSISADEVRQALRQIFEALGPKKRVLAIPPDFTRLNSYAGPITEMCHDILGGALTDIMPALGTHSPMTDSQIAVMFGHTPRELFRVHDWRNDVVTVGEVPSEYIRRVSEGRLDYAWPAQVNRLLVEGGYDLILSIGQVVPHEVIGMANYTKNIFVGVGGAQGINRSHFLGATYGMERIMGRPMTPVREVMEYARREFLPDLPIVYIQTVLSVDEATGRPVLRGLFAGDDIECFNRAAELSLEVNFSMLDREIHKCIVWLDPAEFKSTWLGNKAIYRTRMALADGAQLIILAPALKEFGEDPLIDSLIRRYGYRGTPATLRATAADPELGANLSASAHLIHGSSEGRFGITYCPGKGMSREEIESVGFNWADLDATMEKYGVNSLRDGWNTVGAEEIFFISNPALGLWAYRNRFKD